MHKITNLTNGPLDLYPKDGRIVIGVKGTETAEFSDEYIELLKMCGAVKVEPVSRSKKTKRK